ncbi:mobile genetic element [Streptococcus pneumoniae]|nr:mobile genetic element [Streptococcus pneumoniae]
MNDEASKQLTDARFKRLVGVQRIVKKDLKLNSKLEKDLKY